MLEGLLLQLSPGSEGKGFSMFEGVDTIDSGETLRLPSKAGSDCGDIDGCRFLGSSSPRSCKARSAAEGSGARARAGFKAGDNFGVGIVFALRAARRRACSVDLVR